MSSDSSSLSGRSVELVPRPRYRARSDSDKDLRTRLPGLRRITDWVGQGGEGFLVGQARAWHGWRYGRLPRNVAVRGPGGAAVGVAQRLEAGSDEANVVGVFIDGGVPAGGDTVVGDSDLLASLANAGEIDEIILALPWNPPSALHQTIAKFSASQVELRLGPG